TGRPCARARPSPCGAAGRGGAMRSASRDVDELLAEPPLGNRYRHERLAVRPRDDVDPQLPAIPWLELDAVGDGAAVDGALLREDHLRPHRRLRVLEEELVVCGVEARFDERR